MPALDNAAMRRTLPPVIFALFVGALAKLLAGGETTVKSPPVENVLPATGQAAPLAAGRYRTPSSITPTVHFAVPDSGWIATVDVGSGFWRLDRRKGGAIVVFGGAFSAREGELQLNRMAAIDLGGFLDSTFGTRAARQAEGLARSTTTIPRFRGFELARGDRFRIVFANAGQSTLAVLASGRGLGFLDFLTEAKRIFRTFRID